MTVKQYAALAAGFLATKMSDAQIIHTEINKDIITPDTFLLDLDNNGTVDYKLVLQYYRRTSSEGGVWHTWQSIRNNNKNAFVAHGNYAFGQPSDSIIGSNEWWEEGSVYLNSKYRWRRPTNSCSICYISEKSSNGDWRDNLSYYLGLRLHKSGQYYYGWIRLQAHGPTALFIEDCAVNSIPDSSIKAGQTIITSANDVLNGIPIISVNSNKNLRIQFRNESFLNGEIEITNTLGQVVEQIPVTGNIVQKSLTDFSEGIYILHIRNDKNHHTYTKEIIIS
jgi:hypothetical protein